MATNTTLSPGDFDPGERVVTHGNFLIDSQTRLTGSITGMFGGSKAFGTDAQATQAPSQNYTVTLRSDPSPPKGGSDGMFHVTVTGPDGKPVTDAQVKVTLVMPAMPAMGMGEMRSVIHLTWNGSEYVRKRAHCHGRLLERYGGSQPEWTALGVYRSRLDAK